MKSIVNWLRRVELLASETYLLASTQYDHRPELKKFLVRTAEEETTHYHAMGNAVELLSKETDIDPAISIDHQIQIKITGIFHTLKTDIESQRLSRQALLEFMVTAELSEWNDIFIYVVDVLKSKSSNFNHLAANMQTHMKTIAHYVENVEQQPEIVQKIKELPPIWIEKILVVDDMPIISNLVKNLLNREGDIDIAENGKQALEMIEKKYYKLIICDIDMPVMDGMALFTAAATLYPKLRSKFLFMTGHLSQKRNRFLQDNHLKYLEKPMGIAKLRDEANKILLQ